MIPLTLDLLKELLSYDPSSGEFTRLVSTSSNAMCGDTAWHLTSNGYIYIRINGRFFPAHRLAWFYMTGKWPSDEVDHVNGIKNDNRFENLREVTHAQNQWNKGKPKNNNSGFKGVCWHKQTKSWRAKLGFHGKHYQRYFKSKLQALLWLHQMRKKLHGEFAKAA